MYGPKNSSWSLQSCLCGVSSWILHQPPSLGVFQIWVVALGDGVSGDCGGVAGSWLMILGIFSKLSQFTTLILLAFAPLGVTLLFGTRRGSAGLSKEGQP